MKRDTSRVLFYILRVVELTRSRKSNTKSTTKSQNMLSYQKGLKARIGGKTLTRRFRLGSLAGRGKFPSKLKDYS
jgi:hypothetical protein